MPNEAEECNAFANDTGGAPASGVCGGPVGVVAVAGSGRLAPLLASDEMAVSSSMPLERLGVVAPPAGSPDASSLPAPAAAAEPGAREAEAGESATLTLAADESSSSAFGCAGGGAADEGDEAMVAVAAEGPGKGTAVGGLRDESRFGSSTAGKMAVGGRMCSRRTPSSQSGFMSAAHLLCTYREHSTERSCIVQYSTCTCKK